MTAATAVTHGPYLRGSRTFLTDQKSCGPVSVSQSGCGHSYQLCAVKSQLSEGRTHSESREPEITKEPTEWEEARKGTL